MKIIFFDFFIHFGGGPQLVADTARRLAVNNEVEVINVYGTCKPYLKRFTEAGIKVHVMVPEAKNVYIGYSNKKLIRLWRIICQLPILWKLRKRLIKKILEINPDIIWANEELALLFLATSFRLRRYSLVMEVVGCPEAATIRGYAWWLMKYRLGIIMAISTETSQQLQLAGINRERINIVFDTIDFKDTITRSEHNIEAPLPFLAGSPRILLPANLIPAKGQDSAIRAISRLKSEGIEPVLWIAGDVVGNNLSYQYYLENLAKELKVSSNVHLLGWREDVPAIMKQADIVILPTHSEGFGHVILEAMLLRRPVIATPVGGIKDSIEDGVNGLSFPVNDDKTLADKIMMLHIDKELVARLTENGYKTVTEKFNPENHTRKCIEALEYALKFKRK